MAMEPARSQPSRQLWQVPVFFLGAGVLIAIAFTRTQWRADDEPGAARRLSQARAALAQSPPDWSQAIQLGQRIMKLASRFPQFEAEANFLVGSAMLGQAESVNDADGLTQARAHLETADRLGVAVEDQPKLSYRLAKVCLLLGVDTAPATAALAKSVEFADDLAEGYGLLAQAYLKADPPDVPAAIEATKQQLAKATPTSDIKVLSGARLRLGELYLKQNAVKEGRQTLERIGNDAPPETALAAHSLLANSYETSQDWSKAARYWAQVKTNPKVTGPAKGSALYHLGRCCAQDQRPKEAAAAWEECAAMTGDEGQAALIRLAELKAENDPKTAPAAFAAALQVIRAPEDYRNTLIPLDEARQILERAAAMCRAKGEVSAAQSLVDLYSKLAPPGKDDELQAQSADSAAQELVEREKQTPGDAALGEQARGQFLIAARAYERAAGKVSPGPEQAQWLWRAADRYLKARQQQAALDVLTRMTQLEGVLADENIADAWFQLASLHHQKLHYAAARSAYQRCLKLPGKFAFSARHQIAMLDMIENKFDEAETALQENRTALRAVVPPDVAMLEQTEYALAAVAFQRQTAVKEELREYVTAEQRYLGALQQYPDSAEAPKARLYLGRCYWFEVVQKSKALSLSTISDDERRAYQKQMGDAILKAAEQFEKIEETLLTRQKGGPLRPDDEQLLWSASFSVAECYFYSSRFDEAIRRYGLLALRYQGQVGELAALSQIFQCYSYTKQSDKAQAIIARMREAFDKMPDSAFTGANDRFQRTFWVKWFADASRQNSTP